MSEKFTVHKENIIALVLFLVLYLTGLLVDNGILTFVLLSGCAIVSYILFVRASGSFVDLRGILSLSWELGIALAALRLSRMHTPWTLNAKLSFGLFIACFLLASAFSVNRTVKNVADDAKKIDRLEKLIIITSATSFAFFMAEAIILGYIPIFSKDTHAYNYFHITGLHYFTVSSVMTHALTAIYISYLRNSKLVRSYKWIVIANIVSLLQTIMLISKFQLLLSVALPMIILISENPVKSFKSLPWKKIIVGGVVFVTLGIVAVVAITKLRHYEPGYLDGIFEFREESTPIYIQYPYMYVAHNFANFNYLTEHLTEYTYGLRQCFPIIALTGLKFIKPGLASYPFYIIKPELSTLTMIYDAYADFGVFGVALLGVLLGVLGGYLVNVVKNKSNAFSHLLYGQIVMYFALSFFSSWFTVPTTWFWFGLTFIYYIVMKGGRKNG